MLALSMRSSLCGRGKRVCYLWTATRAVGITFDWRADTAFNFCGVGEPVSAVWRRASIKRSSPLVLRAEPWRCGPSGPVLRAERSGTASSAGWRTGLRLTGLGPVTRILLPEAF